MIYTSQQRRGASQHPYGFLNFSPKLVFPGDKKIKLSKAVCLYFSLLFKNQMEFPALWIIVSLLACALKSACDPRATESALICSNISAANSDRQVFVANFLATMDSVTPQIARQKYGVVVNGTGNNTVYTFGECLKDLSQNDCDLCFARCKTQILRCLPFQRLVKGGRLFYDGCYLRYDGYRFFNESLSSVDRTVCGGGDFVGNQTLFGENVMELARNMREEGPKTDGFFTGFVNKGNLTVYGLAQCWEFVKGGDCVKCLESSVSRIGSCPPKVEGRVLNAGCYLRYSLTRFYNNSGTDSSGGGGGSSNRHTTILASVFAAIAFLLFVAVISLFGMMKILRLRREKKKLGSVLAIVNKSKINFSYEHLEKATNYFHISNKLGQGGSGAVYKGTLPGGKIVAVKRLFFNTSQWADHFFNEVNLISGIDHKNLVKLLGCSITGPESLLVYEYVPNQSLHYHLFGRKHGQSLSWEDRCKIILGIASGLAFLHEGSQLRIIHRDIKLSNVLLDNDFTPKIADFGLARLFPDDQSHISTAIAGTLGYMAPEYIVCGKLTEKADVYSFGVLAIEVICGAKNTDSFPILQKVWNLYGSGKASEAVDPSIKGIFPEEEASRLLQIGLICVQADAEIRPSMSTIVKTLTHAYEIPQPTQPPFLSSTSSGMVGQFKYQPGTYFHSPVLTLSSSGNEITESFTEPR